MPDDPQQTVLQRKLVAAPTSGARVAMSPARALEQGVARAAQDELGLEVALKTLTEGPIGLEDLAGKGDDNALRALLTGPEGRVGLMVVSGALMGAILEQRMTGGLRGAGAPPRPPTRIDVEIGRDLIDRILREFAALMEPVGGGDWARGFRFETTVLDPRLLRFALGDLGYNGFEATLDMGAGVRQGDFFLALPETGGPDAEGALGKTGWSAALRNTVMGAEMPVDAVFARLTLPLAAVSDWKPGDMLPLPRHTLDGVQLEGANRVVLATGRLGQARGDKAIRINLQGADLPPLLTDR